MIVCCKELLQTPCISNEWKFYFIMIDTSFRYYWLIPVSDNFYRILNFQFAFLAKRQGKWRTSNPRTFLTPDIIGVGRTLVTDNWYRSLHLAKIMLDYNTHLFETIGKNRKGYHRMLSTKNLIKREIVAMEKNGRITVLKCKDQRDVLILFTKHDVYKAWYPKVL